MMVIISWSIKLVVDGLSIFIQNRNNFILLLERLWTFGKRIKVNEIKNNLFYIFFNSLNSFLFTFIVWSRDKHSFINLVIDFIFRKKF